MLTLGVESFSGTTLLDWRSILAAFHACWCPFCTNFLKVFEATMREKNNPLAALVDISDMDNPLWETFDVAIVPTLIGFRNGQAFVRKDGTAGVGLSSKELEDALREMENY